MSHAAVLLSSWFSELNYKAVLVACAVHYQLQLLVASSTIASEMKKNQEVEK